MVLDALIPIFFSGGPLVTPPKDLSTIKDVTLSTSLPLNLRTIQKLISKILQIFLRIRPEVIST